MTSGGEKNSRWTRRRFRISVGLTIGSILVFAVLVQAYWAYFPAVIGPAQPIPFSHRVHAGKKEISCFFCHEEAIFAAEAGIPPLERCMLCHKHIIIEFPPIKELRNHYANREPIIWEQVYQLPDYVYFNHSVHIHRAVDCSVCHGDVLKMDRIIKVHDMTMGFCVGCHREYAVSHDCFTCHR